MPTDKTETTELSVGFGLLDLDPNSASIDSILNGFENTIDTQKINGYRTEFNGPAHKKYEKFIGIGRKLRETEPLLNGTSKVKWSGPQKQAATITTPKDLLVGNMSISIKDDSNVVSNASPYNIFVTIPKGTLTASRSNNWYNQADKKGIEALYDFVKGKVNNNHLLTYGLPIAYTLPDYDAFITNATNNEKRMIQFIIENLSKGEKEIFNKKYTEMCLNVAKYSADIFNNELKSTLKTPTGNSVKENVIKHFFRINAAPYFLVGLDGGRAFAVNVPDITTWKREWEIYNIAAKSDDERKQSVVNFRIDVKEKKSKIIYELPFHVEIRWSHGKFCGSPEGKLYKEFEWSSVPFFKVIF